MSSNAIQSAITGLAKGKEGVRTEQHHEGFRVVAFIAHDMRTHSGKAAAEDLFSAAFLKAHGIPKGYRVYFGRSWVNREGRMACYLSVEEPSLRETRKAEAAARYAKPAQAATQPSKAKTSAKLA